MMQYRGEDGSRTRGLSPVIGPTTPDEGWQGEAELIAGRASQLSRRDARKELRPASRWVEGRHPRQEFVISGRGETMWQGPGLSWRHSARTEPAATASVQSQVRSDADRGPLSRTFTQASRTAQLKGTDTSRSAPSPSKPARPPPSTLSTALRGRGSAAAVAPKLAGPPPPTMTTVRAGTGTGMGTGTVIGTSSNPTTPPAVAPPGKSAALAEVPGCGGRRLLLQSGGCGYNGWSPALPRGAGATTTRPAQPAGPSAKAGPGQATINISVEQGVLYTVTVKAVPFTSVPRCGFLARRLFHALCKISSCFSGCSPCQCPGLPRSCLLFLGHRMLPCVDFAPILGLGLSLHSALSVSSLAL